jgi:hypothetical protein
MSHVIGMTDPESEPEKEARMAAKQFIRLLPFNNLWAPSAAMRYAQDNGIIPKLQE